MIERVHTRGVFRLRKFFTNVRAGAKKTQPVRIYRAQELSGEVPLEQLTLGRFLERDYAGVQMTEREKRR